MGEKKKFCYFQEQTDVDLDCITKINEGKIFPCPYTWDSVKYNSGRFYIDKCPRFTLLIDDVEDIQRVLRKTKL
jgi:hypothetical protein